MLKRVFDLCAASVGLVLCSPVLLGAALAILIDSGRPVLFRQERVGLGTRPFRLYKFRSMVVDAARIGPYSTAQNDPRITRVGAILRRTSIDELPQLLNVLLGHMSLVGPRPDVPAQRANYTAEQWALRHRVRPGLTGLAQALYRSSATASQRLDADLDYASNPGLLRDLHIIWLTVGQVLRGRGSN